MPCGNGDGWQLRSATLSSLVMWRGPVIIMTVMLGRQFKTVMLSGVSLLTFLKTEEIRKWVLSHLVLNPNMVCVNLF